MGNLTAITTKTSLEKGEAWEKQKPKRTKIDLWIAPTISDVLLE